MIRVWTHLLRRPSLVLSIMLHGLPLICKCNNYDVIEVVHTIIIIISY